MQTFEDEIEKQFYTFANDETDNISIGDLPLLFSALKRNYSTNYIQTLLSEEGLDHNNELTLEEFLLIFRLTKNDQKRADNLENALKIFDEDNDGMISVADFKALMSVALVQDEQPLIDEAAQEKIIGSFEKNDDLLNIKQLCEKVIYTITIANEDHEDEKVTESEDKQNEAKKETEGEEKGSSQENGNENEEED